MTARVKKVDSALQRRTWLELEEIGRITGSHMAFNPHRVSAYQLSKDLGVWPRMCDEALS